MEIEVQGDRGDSTRTKRKRWTEIEHVERKEAIITKDMVQVWRNPSHRLLSPSTPATSSHPPLSTSSTSCSSSTNFCCGPTIPHHCWKLIGQPVSKPGDGLSDHGVVLLS